MSWSVPVLEKHQFQPPVIGRRSDPPSSPSTGDRYLIISPATGDWAGKEGVITIYASGTWQFVYPDKGFVVFVIDEYKFYVFDLIWKQVSASLFYQSGLRAYLSGEQTITTGSWDIVEFNSLDYDIQNEADGVNYRFVAKETGRYIVHCSIGITNGNNIGNFHFGVFKNGSLHSSLNYYRRPRRADNPVLNGSCIVELNSTEYLDIRVLISSGNNVRIGGGSANTWLTISKI